jgi:uncharacterized repeat protein (TIGR02543 family)
LTVYGSFTLTASYTQIQYTFTVTNPGAAGTVTMTPSQATYHYGDVVTIQAVASPGYYFASWTVAGAALGPNVASTTVTVTNNVSLTALFTQNAAPPLLFSFDGTHGVEPSGGALLLSGTTLYGMTTEGGFSDEGTIFSIPTIGGTPTVLFSFDGPHGANPYGGLIQNGSLLYGMTSAGGAKGMGTVFSMPMSGGTPMVLCSFSGSNGACPHGSLIQVGPMLYGMTSEGGANGYGTIFGVNVATGSQTILFSFDNTHGVWDDQWWRRLRLWYDIQHPSHHHYTAGPVLV